MSLVRSPKQVIIYTDGACLGNLGPGGYGVEVKTLHAKIGELALENDFLERALGKAGLLSAKR